MANLLDLKGKIKSTQNTGQITKALELVSASRQKKALEFLQNSRSLRVGTKEIMNKIMDDSSILGSLDENLKFFNTKSTGKILILTVMSNRGLCGPINTNLFFEIVKFKKEFESKSKKVDFISVNKVSQKYLKGFKENIIAYFSDIKENPTIDQVYPIIDYVKENFDQYEEVYLAYTNFVKTGIFAPKITKLLPLSNKKDVSDVHELYLTYSIEPDAKTLLESLTELYISLEIYEAVLSEQTSEHSARMIAMKKASDNAKDIVSSLTLKYNKERQSKITQAMAEISANI